EKILKVGVFVDAPLTEIKEIAAFCHLDLLQLHGSEDDAYCAALSGFNLIKVLRLGGKSESAGKPVNENFWATLLDTWLPDQAGGGGRVFDWQLAKPFAGSRFILAGGLTPDNVKTAIAQTRPFGVDVSSGVEAAPGIKDREKMARFINAVKEADKLNISITEQVK
ncbi:MAG TPA: phosphoribosylanthranilate isomerase, partial [Desulfarculaceae bacterium]|nr:phosphoribosylanthranilate isomerase [Desulfarculaceae bacterium]